jgi:hypothetical protein
MRVTLQELMEKLGVPHTLTAYETWPFAATDIVTNKTMNAEVRMNPDGDEMEAEIQLVEDDDNEMGSSDSAGIQQLCWILASPFKDDIWSVKALRIKNENWVGKVYGWEEKCCNLFRVISLELSKGILPDFDEVVDKEMREKERFGDSRGGGAGKSPKIRPAQLLNLKKGAGF